MRHLLSTMRTDGTSLRCMLGMHDWEIWTDTVKAANGDVVLTDYQQCRRTGCKYNRPIFMERTRKPW